MEPSLADSNVQPTPGQEQSTDRHQTGSSQFSEDQGFGESKEIPDRKWFWAFPQIEGVPPSARGGHTATLIGASILFFGVSLETFAYFPAGPLL